MQHLKDKFKNFKSNSISSDNNLLNLNPFLSSNLQKSPSQENICLSEKSSSHLNSNNQYSVDIEFYSDLEEKRTNLLDTSNIKQNRNKSLIILDDFNSSQNIQEDNEDVPMLNPNFESNETEPIETCAQIAHNSSTLTKSQASDHCHVPKENNEINKKRNSLVWRKLITVLVLCILFMVGEIIGGIIAQSISIQTDAAHMAADIAGFFFSIVAIYVSDKEPTRRMSFGYYRSEVLGALFSTLLIWVLTGVLVYLAVLRCISQDFDIEPKAMVITASCGVVFNIIMYFVLHTNKCVNGINLKHHGHSHSGDGHGHGHSHNHGHSHSSGNHNHSHSTPKRTSNAYSIPINDNYSIDQQAIIESDEPEIEILENDSTNINLRAAAIHVIGDFIQSVGVLIAAIIIYIKPEYKLADPICTFIFSVLVFLTTAPIIKDIYYVLMEALPVNLNYDLIVQDLLNIDHVKKAHNLHIWCLTMDKFALAVHLVVERNSDTQQVLKDANNVLRSKYKIERTTIQVEYFIESMNNCDQCKLPK